MPSTIDPAKPQDGVPAVKADLRANLQAAKTELDHGGFAEGLSPGNYGPPATSRVSDHLSAIDTAIGQLSGPNSFIGLADTPADYAGQATQFVKVKADETGLEFAAAPGVNSFIGLADTPAGYAGQATQFVKVKADETGLEFAAAPGVNSFIGLADTPADYAGQATQFVKVKADETGLEFAPAPGGSGGLTGWVDVKDITFGAVGNGTTPDTTAIQAALNSGAAVVYLPPGTYRITSPLTIPPGVSLVGSHRGSTIISAVEITGSPEIIKCTGSTTSLPALSSATVEHGATIVFASSVSSSLKHGDWFYLYDSTPSSFTPFGSSTFNTDGFFAKVYTAEGATVYTAHGNHRALPAPRTGGALSAVTSVKLDQRGVAIRNLTVRGPGYNDTSASPTSNVTVCKLIQLARVHIENCEFLGGRTNALALELCADVHLRSVTASNVTSEWNGSGAYGLWMRGTSHLYATDCIFISSRHAINVEGFRVPNHDVSFKGGLIMTPATAEFQLPGSSFVTAFNTHEACRHVIVQGARIYGGIDLRGCGHVIKDCLIHTAPGAVGAIELFGMAPHMETEIVGNVFHVWNAHFQGGNLLSGKDDEFTVDAGSVPSHLKFNDNICYFRTAAAGAGSYFMLKDTGAKNANVGFFEFCRNKFICTVTPSSTPSWFDINFDGHHIKVEDNFGTHGTLGTWNSGFTHSRKDGNFVNSTAL